MPPIRTIRTAVLGGFGIGAAIGGPLLIAYSVWALQAPTSAAFDRCQEVCDPILVGAVLALQGAWYSALVGAVCGAVSGLLCVMGVTRSWSRSQVAGASAVLPAIIVGYVVSGSKLVIGDGQPSWLVAFSSMLLATGIRLASVVAGRFYETRRIAAPRRRPMNRAARPR
jgi:hypothetical protein